MHSDLVGSLYGSAVTVMPLPQAYTSSNRPRPPGLYSETWRRLMERGPTLQSDLEALINSVTCGGSHLRFFPSWMVWNPVRDPYLVLS